jgi:hypothetical protein
MSSSTAATPLDLGMLIAWVARLDEAGLLDEARAEIGDRLGYGPADPLDAATLGERMGVDRLGRLAHGLGLASLAACRAAAADYCGLSRRAVGIEVLRDYVCQLDQAEAGTRRQSYEPVRLSPRAGRQA